MSYHHSSNDSSRTSFDLYSATTGERTTPATIPGLQPFGQQRSTTNSDPEDPESSLADMPLNVFGPTPGGDRPPGGTPPIPGGGGKPDCSLADENTLFNSTTVSTPSVPAQNMRDEMTSLTDVHL